MKNVHKVLVAISVLFANLLLLAETEFANGYTWTYRIVGEGAEIYGYADSDGGWYIAASPEPAGAVTIPSTLGDKPVTNIGEGSFRNCGAITSVAIPDGVTNIGEEAFRKCKGLTSVTIPNSATSIGYKAFYGCTSLTSVTIPHSVTSIGDFVFCNCSGLTSMTIPDSVTRIGEGAYLGCTGLADKYGFVIVRDVLYSYCGGGGDITIPDSVTKIGNYAFQNCTDLTSVTIPDSVTDIGDGVFAGCTGLADKNGFVIVRDVLHCYCGDGGDVTIPDGVTSIGDCAFLGCTSMTSVTIPDSVARIGKEAFCECSSLTSVTIPVNVMSIEEETFEGCIGLTSVTIPISVTRIDKEAFEGCIGLTSVTIPESVISIGKQAFNNCGSLTNMIFKGNAPSVDTSAFYNVTPGCVAYVLRSTTGWGVTIPGIWNGIRIDYIDGPLFAIEDGVLTGIDLYGATEVTIPNSVTSIGSYAFSGCGDISNISFPSSVTNVGEFAFQSCTNLSDVAIPDSVIQLGDDAFLNCTGLRNVAIGNGVNYISQRAFSGCVNLEYVTIGSNVTSIGIRAFDACSGLKSMTFLGDAPSAHDPYEGASYYDDSFYGTYAAWTVFVKKTAKGFDDDRDGKWHRRKIEYYGADISGGTLMSNEDGKYYFAANPDSTFSKGDFLFSAIVGGVKVDTTKAYNVQIENGGKSATVSLMSPFEVEKSDGISDEPWTEDGEGNVLLNVEVVPGLYYAADSATSLGELSCPGADTPATAETKLVIKKPNSDAQGFYKIWVSETPLKAGN